MKAPAGTIASAKKGLAGGFGIIDRVPFAIESNTNPADVTFSVPAQPGDVVVALVHYYAGGTNANLITGLGITSNYTQLSTVAPSHAVLWGQVTTGGSVFTLNPHVYRGGYRVYLLRGIANTLVSATGTGTVGPSQNASAGQVVLFMSTTGSPNSTSTWTYTKNPTTGWVDGPVMVATRTSSQDTARVVPAGETNVAHQVTIAETVTKRMTQVVVG